MIHIGNLVRTADDLPLQGFRDVGAGVAQDAQPDLVGQVEPLSVLFQAVHHPQALFIVPEGFAPALGQGRFPGMAEGRVAQIVAHGDGLRQIFVEAQGPGDGLGDAGNLQGMGHPGAVVVPLWVQKHRGLVHQPAEGLAVDHPVRIPLVAGAHILLPFRLRSGAAGAPVGKGCQRIQPPVLQTFQFFPHGHCHHSLIFVSGFSQVFFDHPRRGFLHCQLSIIHCQLSTATGNARYSWPISMASTVPLVMSRK